MLLKLMSSASEEGVSSIASDLISESELESEILSGSEMESETETSTSVPDSNETPKTTAKRGIMDNLGSILMIVGIVAVFVYMYFKNKKIQKKQQEEAQKLLDAIKPGTNVRTIGGVWGVVTEVTETSVVLETGGETKSYITFDKRAIAESDAVVEEKAEETEAPVEETETAEEKTEEANDKE